MARRQGLQQHGVRFTIATLVERTGVPASTIHHYHRASLLPPPLGVSSNRFLYDERHVEAVRLIRVLRERRGLSLARIREQLPRLLAEHGEAFRSDLWRELAGSELPPAELTVARRLVDAAIEMFRTRGYADVCVSDIAELAGVAKGSVYRHFASKEALFATAVETLVADVAAEFAAAVEQLGPALDVEKAGSLLTELLATGMPVIMELCARAARGHPGSRELARRTLRQLADAAGRPLSEESATAVGLSVVQKAIAATFHAAMQPFPELTPELRP